MTFSEILSAQVAEHGHEAVAAAYGVDTELLHAALADFPHEVAYCLNRQAQAHAALNRPKPVGPPRGALTPEQRRELLERVIASFAAGVARDAGVSVTVLSKALLGDAVLTNNAAALSAYLERVPPRSEPDYSAQPGDDE